MVSMKVEKETKKLVDPFRDSCMVKLPTRRRIMERFKKFDNARKSPRTAKLGAWIKKGRR